MATAAEIADLITQGMQGPTGPDDSGWHVGRIITWSSSTGLNSVLVNNTLMTNLRALAPSVGTEYVPGQSVLIVRKQTQYFILGQVQVPGSTGSTPPTQKDGATSNLTGTTGVWKDLDTPANSPTISITLAPYQRCLFMFGANRIRVWGVEVDVSLIVTSPGGTNKLALPDQFIGQSIQVDNQISVSNYISVPAFKTFFAKTSSGNTDPSTELMTPGVNVVSMKYRLQPVVGAGGAGTPSAVVGNPWLLAIPF